MPAFGDASYSPAGETTRSENPYKYQSVSLGMNEGCSRGSQRRGRLHPENNLTERFIVMPRCDAPRSLNMEKRPGMSICQHNEDLLERHPVPGPRRNLL